VRAPFIPMGDLLGTGRVSTPKGIWLHPLRFSIRLPLTAKAQKAKPFARITLGA
jgi:hypothetical protein